MAKDTIQTSWLSYYKPEDFSFQKGGKVAITPQEQNFGLNDSRYDTMQFPLTGQNIFRGTDDGRPVHITDSTGKQRVLRGKEDTDVFTGTVKERRVMQGGGPINPPIYTSDKNKDELDRYYLSPDHTPGSNQYRVEEPTPLLNKLPIQIRLSQPEKLQTKDPYSLDPANYQYNYNGQFVPDEYHRALGYPNKMQQGGNFPEANAPQNYQHTQWGYAEPLRTKDNPNYHEYTQMYSVDNWSGLYEKPKSMGDWSGFGKDENLYTGAAPTPTYTGPVAGGIATTGNESYSIDSARKDEGFQYGGVATGSYDFLDQGENGQVAPVQKKGKKVDRSLYSPHPSIRKAQQGMSFEEKNPETWNQLKTITPQQIQQNQIQAQQNNTPGVGQKVSWQDQVRNRLDASHYLPTGAGQDLVGNATNFVTYPAVAATNLTQPKRYFEQTRNSYEAAANMLLDAGAVVAPLAGKIKGKPSELPRYSDNFPVKSIGKAKTPTAMPYETVIDPKTVETHNIGQELDEYGYPMKGESHISMGFDPTTNNPWSDANINKAANNLMSDEDFYKKMDERLMNIRQRDPANKEMFIAPSAFGKGELFEKGYDPRFTTNRSPWEGEFKMRETDSRNPDNITEHYTDFGKKTSQQLFEKEGRADQFPESLKPKVRQQNKKGGEIKSWLNNY